jgi:hypothetical protein
MIHQLYLWAWGYALWWAVVLIVGGIVMGRINDE